MKLLANEIPSSDAAAGGESEQGGSQDTNPDSEKNNSAGAMAGSQTALLQRAGVNVTDGPEPMGDMKRVERTLPVDKIKVSGTLKVVN